MRQRLKKKREPYREIVKRDKEQRGDEDVRLQQSLDEEREGKARMLLQAVQEIHFLRGLCIDENLQVQSKCMLWP